MSGWPADAVLVTENLSVTRGHGRYAHAVLSGLDLAVRRGEIIGISGTSGAGKTSLINALSGELLPARGRVVISAGGLTGPPRDTRRQRPGSIALIAQDPMATLDGLWSIGRSIAEPLHVAGTPRREVVGKVRAALDTVGLSKVPLTRLPRELSIGQAQRVCIARALVAEPVLLLADEPTSALDVVSAARVVGLLQAAAARGTALIIVSHDHRLLDAISSRRFQLLNQLLEPLGVRSLDEPLTPKL